MKLIMLLIAALVAARTDGQTQPAPSERTLTVSITVSTYDDKQLDPVVFTIHGGETPVALLTDENGRASAEVSVTDDTKRLCVWPFAVRWAEDLGLTRTQMYDQVRLARELQKQYFIERRYCVGLPSTNDPLDISIVLQPAITVRGSFVDETGARIGAAVRGPTSIAVSPDGRSFELHGVQQATAEVLYAKIEDRIVPIDLTKEQTMQDCDLGQIVVHSIDRNAKADFIIDQTERKRDPENRAVGGVVFVSPDGSIILTDIIHAGDADPRSIDPSQWRLSMHFRGGMALPEGKYFVAPRYFSRTDEQVALIEALRAGVDITAYGVPSFEVRKGRFREITLVLADAERAIEKLMKDREDADN